MYRLEWEKNRSELKIPKVGDLVLEFDYDTVGIGHIKDALDIGIITSIIQNPDRTTPTMVVNFGIRQWKEYNITYKGWRFISSDDD